MTAARARKPRVAQAALPLQMPEGVHLRLPEEVYFQANALGSSDLKTLYWDPATWWYTTDLNERRRSKVSRKSAKDLGSALHALVLEGETAYTSRFTIEPDAGDTRWAKTPSEIRRLLEQHGANVHGLVTEAQLMPVVKARGLSDRVWASAWQGFEQARGRGTRWLTRDEDRRIRDMADLIAGHHELGPSLKVGLPEVSVFWRRPDDTPTLLRARFDFMQARRDNDLKTVGNWQGRDIDAAVRRAIDEYGYMLQRRLYHEARSRAREFILDGKVFAWGAASTPDGMERAAVLDDEREILAGVAQRDEWDWRWIFCQLRCDDVGAERAPVIAPRFHVPAGRMWDEAGKQIEEALTHYRDLRREFSLQRPWAVVEPCFELTDEDVHVRSRRRYAQ